MIIVNDCSTDNSMTIFKYLLETDPRIRLFNHLKNMGVWRSRLDGILYSRGKYIIAFDIGDLYEDNYVLEDAFNLMEKYNLDSIKFLFGIIKSFDTIKYSIINFHVYDNSKIIYESSNIEQFNDFIFKKTGNVWNRLIRSNIYTKGLYLLNDFILNIYKNLWEDVWHNTIINKASYSFLVIERIGYIYVQDGTGYGSLTSQTKKEGKDKMIKEFLYFLYFDYYMLPKTDNKTIIIKSLKNFNSTTNPFYISYLKTKIYIYNNLLNLLIKDPYVNKDEKIVLNKLLDESKIREYKLINEK